MSKVCRVLRVLEYTGTPEWVADCITRREIKGRWVCPNGQISEAIVGEIPELLEYAALAADADRLLERTTCPACGGGRLSDPRDCKACMGIGYRDGSGPWPESAREQAEASRRLVDAATEEALTHDLGRG